MRLFRSHRRTITAALAATALVLQALLPHVHAWQSGDHGVALAFASLGQGARLAVTIHDTDHERRTCPTCQALAQSRQLGTAPRSITLVFVPLHPAEPIPVGTAVSALDQANLAAPRAPPVSA